MFADRIKDPAERLHNPRSVLSSNGVDHRQMRNTLTQCFSLQTLKAQESVITEYADLLITKLKERSEDGPCDLGMTALTR